MSAGPKGVRRAWRSKLLAATLALLACFVVGEVLVRVLAEAPLSERLPILEVRANAVRGWEMLPGQTHYTYHYPVTVNALGEHWQQARVFAELIPSHHVTVKTKNVTDLTL